MRRSVVFSVAGAALAVAVVLTILGVGDDPNALTNVLTADHAWARLVIEEVPAAGTCRDCGTHTELPGFPLLCRACGSADLAIERGEELLVEALELEERELSHGH